MQTDVLPASPRLPLADAFLPEAVNYHLNKNCNFRCKGCYATFNDDPLARGVMLPREQMFALVEAVAGAALPAGANVRKLTFAGGEPTLCRWLPELVEHAHGLGLVTMVVTNGSRCDEAYLDRMAPHLDWLTVSIDSLESGTNLAIGRHDAKGVPLSAVAYAGILRAASARGIRTKVNTVVNRHNVGEDFSDFLAASGISRWKVLQVMPVEGQNDAEIGGLVISREEFEAFVELHAAVSAAGIRVVPEPVQTIRGTYAMIDPFGRFFDSTRGYHFYSRPILEAGVDAAFAEVSFDAHRFAERGGRYDYTAGGADSTAVPSAENSSGPAFEADPSRWRG